MNGGAGDINLGAGRGGNGGGGSGNGGGGGGGGYSGGGGGGGSSGGGGGSIIDSSAIAIIAEDIGIASPDGSPNGEIIITTVPQRQPTVLASASTAGGNFGFNITGPTNATIVIEVCTNLANPAWIPLTTNVLSNGTSYFSDAHWTNYPYGFYRARQP